MSKSLNKESLKIQLYHQEIPFRITTNLAQLYWSNQWKQKLNKFGLLIIKPEAIMMNKVKDILNIVTKSDFEIIYYSHKKLTETQVFEMWKFGWKDASIERILINQKLFSICNSIILVLRYEKSSEFSASEIITDLKGPSLPDRRKPYQIRSQIKPLNYILNYVHTSDETADYLRELGILFEWDELNHIWDIMHSQKTTPFLLTKETLFREYNFSLKVWLKEIRTYIGKDSIPFCIKTYVQNELIVIEENPNYKISLKLIQMLCQYDIITWDFKTIVIVSNNIKYMDECSKISYL